MWGSLTDTLRLMEFFFPRVRISTAKASGQNVI